MRHSSPVKTRFAPGVLLANCGSNSRPQGDNALNVTIDLNKIAPIGYEICGDRPAKLDRGRLDLRIQMPERIEIPEKNQTFGAKYVEFRFRPARGRSLSKPPLPTGALDRR